jgi:hypothetical protein
LGPRKEGTIKTAEIFEDNLPQDGRHKARDWRLKRIPELQTAKTGQCTILAPDVSMDPEVECLGIPVANLNRTLGKNSMRWQCVVVVSSPKFRFIVQEMRAPENQDARRSRFLIKTDSTSPISLRLDRGFPQRKFPGILNVFQVVSETQLEWKGKSACSIKQ